jgi:hypothetical protein
MPLADAVSQLAERCNAARMAGADFPTVWNTILKTNRLVLGIPIQALQDGKPVLKIRLTTKQHIVHGFNGYAVE